MDELDRAAARAAELPSYAHGRELFSDLVLTVAPVPALQRGVRATYDAERARVAAAPDTRRSVHLSAAVRAWDSAVALAEGRFDDTAQITAEVPGTPAWPIWGDVDRLHGMLVVLERGHHEAVERWMTRWTAMEPSAPLPRGLLASLHGHRGDGAEAARHVDVLRQRGLCALGWSAPLVLRHVAETAAHLTQRALASELLDTLTSYSGQMLTSFTGTTVDGAADRAIGQLLLAVGRVDEAVDRLTAAQSLEQAFGAPALVARTGYWHARARLTRNAPEDHETARHLLEDTLITAQRLGMMQLVRDVEALRGAH